MKTENKNWPEKARLKMIDIPESYPIYKHGFNDGYQYRNEQCQKRDELIKAQDEYIKKVDWIIGNHEMSNMILTRIRRDIEQLKKELQ